MLRVEEEIEDKIRQDVVKMLEAKKAERVRGGLWRGCKRSLAKPTQQNKETKRPRGSSSSSSSSSASWCQWGVSSSE